MVKAEFNRAASSAKALELMVAAGNLDAEDLSLSGTAIIENARAREGSDGDQGKRGDGLMLELQRTHEYLDRLDTLIAETQAKIELLEAQRAEALRLAGVAFELAIEADELIDTLADGVSPEERKQLIELLGPEAADASPEELLILLEAFREGQNATGRSHSNEASDLDRQLAQEREQLDRYLKARDKYANAQSPEERAEIETSLDKFMFANEFEDQPEEPVNLVFGPPSHP